MAKLSVSVDVPLPPEKAWECASDLSRYREWLTIHRLWRSKLPETLEKGAVIESIVEVKGMDLDAAFAPAMLYVNNLDKPGFIGAIGALLADAGINIATFNLGRRRAGGEAVALVSIDDPVTPDLVHQLCAIDGVREVVPLSY